MRVLILGAAGRDFHNFNAIYRDDPTSVVAAFTAAQIPGIADRRYPPSLAGPRYPDGIPIIAEEYPDGFQGAATSDELKANLAAIAGFIATARLDRARSVDGQLAGNEQERLARLNPNGRRIGRPGRGRSLRCRHLIVHVLVLPHNPVAR